MTETAAMPIELRMIAYRKSAKDGIVISFAIHPNDLHAGLASAPIGTRFAAALVEIGDDELSVKPPKEKPEKKSWHEMPRVQQAGLLANDGLFAAFLTQTFGDARAMSSAEFIRHYCKVLTRKDILPDTESARLWDDLVREYRAWNLEPEVVR